MDKFELSGADASRETDDRLNDSCTVSFEVPSYASIHFKPESRPGKDMGLITTERRNFLDALKVLAQRLEQARDSGDTTNKYSQVRFVAATSWILNEKNNKRILTFLGFHDNFGDDEKDRVALKRVYESRREQDGVPQEQWDTEPVSMRMNAKDFTNKQEEPQKRS